MLEYLKISGRKYSITARLSGSRTLLFLNGTCLRRHQGQQPLGVKNQPGPGPRTKGFLAFILSELGGPGQLPKLFTSLYQEIIFLLNKLYLTSPYLDLGFKSTLCRGFTQSLFFLCQWYMLSNFICTYAARPKSFVFTSTQGLSLGGSPGHNPPQADFPTLCCGCSSHKLGEF